MPYLEQFTDDQRDLLISLPYRTGLWVSESDEGGGDESAEAEMQALESIITGYCEDFLKSEFVEELMHETLARKNKWEEWHDTLDSVPLECRQALDVLNERMEEKEVLSFRQSLMEIATAVAMAYCELEEEEDTAGKFQAYFRYYWGIFMARIKKEQAPAVETHLNISRSEREVLGKLSEVLLVDLNGTPIKEAEAA